MNDRRCDRCRFWKMDRFYADKTVVVKNDDRSGECRRNAPIATIPKRSPEDDYSRLPIWPLTMANEWCGEWEGHDADKCGA